MHSRGASAKRFTRGVARAVVVTALGLASATRSSAAAPISETPDPDFWGVDGIVFAIVRVGDVVYIGGDFTSLVSPDGHTTLVANHLAALDVHTGQPTDWQPSTDGTVFALAVAPDGSAIYAGGSFKRIDGVKRVGFAAISPNGDLLWSADCNSKVRAIATLGDTIYIGGSFTKALGQSRSRLAAIQPPPSGGNNGVLLPWSPSVSERVNGLAVANGDVVAMGTFSSPEANQARFDATTGAQKTWEGNIAAVIKACATDGTNYYGAVGSGGGRVVAWTSTGKLKWSKKASGDVQAIAYYNGKVISGGHYGWIDGTLIGVLTALNPANGAIDTSWFPNPDQGLDRGVWVIHAGEKLHVGGAFRKMDKLTVRGYSQFSLTP